MDHAASYGDSSKSWRPIQTRAELVASASSSSVNSLPELPSSSDMNVSSVIVPPKVPPRQRRGSDASPGSPKLASPMKKRQMTVIGLGSKPGSPKIEALKNDPFRPHAPSVSKPLPPPRGRFLRKGERTQSCVDVLQPTNNPKVSKSNSEDNAMPVTTKDDMFMARTHKRNQNHNTTSIQKSKKSENFFILQPNSSSLMTTVITEDTQAVSNDLTNPDETKQHYVPFTKDVSLLESKNKDVTVNNKDPETKQENEMNNDKANSCLNIQKSTPRANSFLESKNDIINKTDKKDIYNFQDKTNSNDAKNIPRDSDIINLQPKEEKLKYNGSLEKKEKDIVHENHDNDIPKDVEKIALDSGDISKSKSTFVKQESSLDIARKKENSDSLNINPDVNNKEEINNDSKDSIKSIKDKVPLQNERSSDMNVQNKAHGGKTRSISNNELKQTTSEKIVPPLSSLSSTKNQGMFDVLGNFTAISDVLPSVSSVTSLTKSLTNASTNIEAMSTSKLSKVVKFDMLTKVYLK